MFDWQKKIKELGKYNITFEIKQGYYHVAVTFNQDWEILESENPSIYIEKRHGVCHYIAQIELLDIADIFKCIDDTIRYNEDLQKKLDLFKEKTNELQEIFAKEEYEKLLTIEFTFKDVKEKKKVVRNKKKEQTTKKKKENKVITTELPQENTLSPLIEEKKEEEVLVPLALENYLENEN